MTPVLTPTVAVTYADFDGAEPFRLVRDGVPIQEFVPLTQDDFQPRDMTPLRDATAKFIFHLDGQIAEGRVTIGLLLDRSGSMQPLRESVVSGVNEFVEGMATVESVDPKAAGKVLAVIMTDGGENASHEYDEAALQALVASREAQGWTFIYLGANQDAWQQGGSLGLSGMASGQHVNYAATPKGTSSALHAASMDAIGYLGDMDTYRTLRSAAPQRSLTEDGAEVAANTAASPTPPPSPAPPPVTSPTRSSGPYSNSSDALAKAKRALGEEREEAKAEREARYFQENEEKA